MIDGKSILAVIAARGGSKGLPRKNVLDVGGKPMVAWSVEAAKQSRYIDRLVLSSDDDEIIAVARDHGCEVPFGRPPELAEDDSSIYHALFHATDNLDQVYDYIVLLQATSPLRVAADIDGCIEQCINNNAPACVSIVSPAKSPYWSFRLDDEDCLEPLLPPPASTNRRQTLPPAYAVNGAVYVARIDWLREHGNFIVDGETRGYVMPDDRSLDVDTALDLTFVRAVIAEQTKT